MALTWNYARRKAQFQVRAQPGMATPRRCIQRSRLLIVKAVLATQGLHALRTAGRAKWRKGDWVSRLPSPCHGLYP